MSNVREILSEIHDRANEAQAGPWFVATEIDGVRAGRNTVVKARNSDGTMTRRVVTVDQTRGHWDETAEANAQFIANARTDVPRLVAALSAILAVDEPWANVIINNCLWAKV